MSAAVPGGPGTLRVLTWNVHGLRAGVEAVGDVLRLGLSHPCTAFDKWQLIPVIDDAGAEQPVVVDLLRTVFG